jgi:hypothetical protein
LPATVNVAIRAVVFVLAEALNVTCPEPLALLPDDTVSQDALLLVVHTHPVGVVTPTEPAPPAAGKAWLVAEIENEQLTPDCVTV